MFRAKQANVSGKALACLNPLTTQDVAGTPACAANILSVNEFAASSPCSPSACHVCKATPPALPQTACHARQQTLPKRANIP